LERRLTLRIFSIPFIAWAGIFSIYPVASQSQKVEQITTIDEPIFGLYYDPREVHFRSILSTELMPACKRNFAGVIPIPKKLTLYGHYEERGTKIYVAGSGDLLGIFVMRDGNCESGVPIMAILQRHHTPRAPIDGPALSESEIEGLFVDILSQYKDAFGGKEPFLRWLDSYTEKARSGCIGQPESSCPPTYHLFQPVLQELMKKFREG